MKVWRTTLVLLALCYVALWVVALNGGGNLIEPLVVPLVLAAMVALGVALTRFVGIAPRRAHFHDAEEDKTTP